MILLNRWLALDQRPTVQVDALWALTNIAAGTPEHTHVLIKHGAIPALVKLLVHAAAAATSSNTAVDSSSSDSADGSTAGSTAIVVASEQQRDDASVMYVSVCIPIQCDLCYTRCIYNSVITVILDVYYTLCSMCTLLSCT
jgi:hypothetical protein